MNTSKGKIIPRKYKNKIESNNEYAKLLSTKYINEKTELKIFCEKHQINYTHSLKNAMRSNGCPECKNENVLNRRTSPDDFEKRIYEKNPHIKLLEKYTMQEQRILCLCNIHNKEFNALPVTLLYGNGGCPECCISRKQRVSSDELKKKIFEINPMIDILDENIRLKIPFKIFCNNCGQFSERTLYTTSIDNFECSVCLNRIIISGYNDLATRRPDLVKYFKNCSDTTIYGINSRQKVDLICPECGYERTMTIEVLSREGFCCHVCGDGISYPNKFIRAFINQLPVENVEFEYSPKWANGLFYDSFFTYKNNDYIIEIDGQQHYKENTNFKMSLEEIRKNDLHKQELALNNHIIFIRIDAQKSNMDYIKKQIENSFISDLFDLNNMNWNVCDEFATTNVAKIICEYAEATRPNNYNILSKEFKLCKDTIRTYIKQGIKFGWCSENVYEKLRVPKRINVYDEENNIVHMFDGIKECSVEMSKLYNKTFNKKGISDNCHNIRNSYKNFIFKFKYNVA